MNSFRRCLAGTLLLGGLSFLATGCGDDSGSGQKIDAPPDMQAKPDLSQMPGYDASKGGMTPPPSKAP